MSTPIPENQAKFSIDEILEATGGVLCSLGAPAESRERIVARGVATDTRHELRDRIFVALKGERFDAHDFLERAVAAEAALLVIQEGERTRSFCQSLSGRQKAPVVVIVRDSLTALGDIACFHRRRWGGQVLGIVGSAGKTTTRSVCSALFGELLGNRLHSTTGNLNNRIGVPMTLLGLTAEHELAVVEIGTNAPGEVAELSRIAVPQAGILTLVDLEHAEGLGGLDGVEREEGALFDVLPETGVAIGYGDDERVARCLKRATCGRRLSYGCEPGRDLLIREREFVRPGQTRLLLEYGGRRLQFESPLSGKPGALAVSAGVLACEALLPGRLDAGTASRALVGVGEQGRTTLVTTARGPLIVDDSYNSNPVSVLHGLETARELASHTGGRLWLVLGEMLELGSHSPEAHREIGEAAAHSGAHALFAVQGDAVLAAEAARRAGLDASFYADAADVSAELAPRVAAGDVVLVKASRGVRAERVVQSLAEKFR